MFSNGFNVKEFTQAFRLLSTIAKNHGYEVTISKAQPNICKKCSEHMIGHPRPDNNGIKILWKCNKCTNTFTEIIKK